MIAFFESPECLSHHLAGYFADHNAPQSCGHCSVCAGKPAQLPKPNTPLLPNTEQLQHWCQPLQAQSPEPLSLHTLACFLSGISTPLLNRLKARQQTGFAKLEQHSFQSIRSALTHS